MAVLLIPAGPALSTSASATGGGPALLGPAQIRELAAELDVRPTKTLGQNFVHDANTVRRIVAASGIGSGDTVLEVGPGLGSLTLALLAEAGRVVAVEIDPKLAARLPRTIAERAPAQAGRFEVSNADLVWRLTTHALIGASRAITTGQLPASASDQIIVRLLCMTGIGANAAVELAGRPRPALRSAPGGKP